MKIDTRTDATTSGLRCYYGEPPRGTSDLILAYVPESEHLTYAEALVLAEVRDRQAAEQLRLSVPDSVFPYTYDEALRGRLAGAARAASKPVLVTQMPESERRPWMAPYLQPLCPGEGWTET